MQRIFRLLAVTSCMFCAFIACGEEDIVGTVTADRLNVRVKPDTGFSAVGSLTRGEKVVVLDKKGDWFKIKAPPGLSVWVASPFVKDDIVQKDVNMRAGPSVAYASYGILKQGVKLKVLDSSREHWIKIVPPVSVSAWTSAQYISLPPTKAEKKEKLIDADKSAERKTGKGRESANKKSDAKSGDKAASAIDTFLPFVKGEPKTVAVEGFLLPVNSDAVYVTHAIAAKVKDEYFPICYVHSDKFNLGLWEKRKIRVKGAQRWVKGWKRPVVEVERITPMWQ